MRADAPSSGLTALYLRAREPGAAGRDRMEDAYRHSVPMLVKVGTRFFGSDRALIEDALQSTWTRILESPPSLTDGRGFTATLVHSMYCRCVDLLRSRRKMRLFAEGEDPASAGRGPEEAIEGGETLEALGLALEGLPAGEREAILAVDYAGMSMAEAERACGVDERNVRARRARALQRLSRILPAGSGADETRPRWRAELQAREGGGGHRPGGPEGDPGDEGDE